MKPLKTKMRGATLLSRGFVFALIWWILSDGAVASWLIGVPAVFEKLRCQMTKSLPSIIPS